MTSEASKYSTTRTVVGTVNVQTISGVIDESLDPAVFANVAGPLVVDLDGVQRITSYGVRQWTRALRSSTASYLVVIRARPCIIVQLNSVSGFLGTADLASFYGPFECSACSNEFDVLYDVRKDWAAISQGKEPQSKCPKCGADATFDDVPDAYFFFTSTLKQPQPPSAVLAYLDGKSPDTVAAPFRVGKDVEGPVTALWFAGNLNEGARFKRVADGLEGSIVIVGSEIATCNPKGAELFAEFLKKLDREIWLARFEESILQQLEVQGELPDHVKVADSNSNTPPAIHEYLATHAYPPISIVSSKDGASGRRDTAGKYRLIRRIGQGGMAEIFVGQLDGPGGFEKKVVIKRILPHLATTSDFVEMFLQEARLAARLSHPNVVQIFEVGSDGGEFFIAMEYVRGIDLQLLLRASAQLHEKIPVGIALHIIVDVCAGLEAAHSWRDDSGRASPIIHRDISPHNILVDIDGHAKLADFGIAKALDQQSQTPTTTIKGKLAYMAPEQAYANEGMPVDHRIDLFSVGIVFYQLLTLNQPFRRENEAQTLYALMNDVPPAPSTVRADIPPEVADDIDRIVANALEKNPLNRFASARVFHDVAAAALAKLKVRPTHTDVAAWLKDCSEKAQSLPGVKMPSSLSASPTGSEDLVTMATGNGPSAKDLK